MATTRLDALKQDKRNARRHTPRNREMIASSIAENGFGRSLLLANDGTIIAGNATAEAAGSTGLDDVLIVESDGSRVIAVKRTDVEPDSPEFRRLALADNRSAELADWDADVLRALAADVDLSPFWDEGELGRLFAVLDDAPPFDPMAEWQGMPEFEGDDIRPKAQLTVYFAAESDKVAFGDLISQGVTDKTRWVWHPPRPTVDPVRWVE